MRAVIQETKQLISVSPNFFRLIGVSSSSTKIRLGYTINQKDALNGKMSQVRITAYTDKEPTREITELTSLGDVNELVDNILLYHQRIRDTAAKNRSKIVFEYNSDFTRKIDNSLLTSIQAGVGKIANRSVVVEKTRTANTIIFGQNLLAEISVPNHTVQNLALSLITKDFTDPSDVTSIQKQIAPVHDLLDGIKKTSKKGSARLTEYLKAVISAASPVNASADLSYSYSVENSDLIDVYDEIEFPRKFDDFSEIFFSFELLGPDGESANTVIKKIRTERELNVFRTPQIPPGVALLDGQSPGQGIIQVTQRDPRASAIQVFRRSLNHSRPIEQEKYVLIAEAKLTPEDGTHSIFVDIESSSTTIFRVISLGEQNAQSPEFTSVILSPNEEIIKLLAGSHVTSSRRFTSISLTSRITTQGVAIDVRKLPYDVIAVRIEKRNISVYESEFSTLGQFSTVDRREVYTFTDSTLQKNNIYEYRCTILFDDGTSTECGTELVEYIPLSVNLVDTRIEELQVVSDSNNYDVKFKISSKIVPSTLDSIKAVLQKQDMLKYFDPHVLAERDKLQGLLAHSVCRVNITTGERESFGISTENMFSDAELGPSNSVQRLEQGNKYRYEVTSLIRQPETMFSKFEKTVTDEVSKRQYTFKPSKYQHPVALDRGNISSEQTLASNHSKDQFSFGNTGSVAIVDVNLEFGPTSIVELRAGQMNADTMEISWKVVGNKDVVDHFLVAKSTLDGREIIGKSHVHRDSGEFYFLHSLERHDIGEITYIVIPILLDYNKASEAISNRVFVATPESHFTSKSAVISGLRKT